MLNSTSQEAVGWMTHPCNAAAHASTTLSGLVHCLQLPYLHATEWIARLQGISDHHCRLLMHQVTPVAAEECIFNHVSIMAIFDSNIV